MKLTERQREVVALLARGLSYPEIGKELSIAERTVRQHVDDIAMRLPGDGQPKVRVLLNVTILLQEAA